MRSIHVLRVVGIDTDHLSNIYHDILKMIHATPPHPKNPEKYQDFNFFNRSCTTLIRDGLRKYGHKRIRGVLPRDFFISAATVLNQANELITQLYERPQLKVPEAPYSQTTIPLNPMNWIRLKNLPKMN